MRQRPRVLPFAGLLAAAAMTARVDGSLFLLGLAATVLLVVWCAGATTTLPGRTELLVVLGLLVVVVGWHGFELDGSVAISVGVGVVLVVALWRRVPDGAVVVGLIVGVVCIGAAGVLDPSDNDVILAHHAAAERVLDGASPYRDLGVPESNPYNYGVPIEGYSYPPVALVTFGLVGRALGGADTVTVIVWAGVVALAIGRYGPRSTATPSLALIPGLPISVAYGWTEPLTLLLVLVGLHLNNTRRATLVGVAMASKQYLVVALPGLVAAWWRRSRWLLAGAAAALVVTVPVVLDLSGAWAALVEFHLDRPVRSDSTNLAGFLAGRAGLQAWPVPSIVVAGVSAGVGVTIARRHGAEGWLRGMLASLVMLLAIGPVALVNYWLLVTGLALLVLGEAERTSVQSGTARPSQMAVSTPPG